MKETNLLPVSVAAREKGCTGQAIKNAVHRGDLNGVRLGHFWMVVRDAKYGAYSVPETGGRLHETYLKRQQEEG